MRGIYQSSLSSFARSPRVGADPEPRFAALRRSLHAVRAFRDRVSDPWYVYAETAYGPEVTSYASGPLAYQAASEREGIPGENYVAVFDVAAQWWPDPVHTHYRAPFEDPKEPRVAVAGSSSSYQRDQYQHDLNRETDLLFWAESHYKGGERLDPRDPVDARMIPVWLEVRSRIARKLTPRMIRQRSAIRATADEHARSHQPFYVYSSSAGLGESLMPFGDVHQAYGFARGHLGDSDYVAFYSVADPRWPGPVFEAFPRDTAGTT